VDSEKPIGTTATYPAIVNISTLRRASNIEYLTIAWAAIEALLALASGIVAGSVALVAFGADSGIEMLSAVVVLIRLRSLVKGEVPDERREHRDHRILAVLFFTLAAYVAISVAIALINRDHPLKSGVGLTICIAASLAMPALALAKRRLSKNLTAGGSTSVGRLLMADAIETELCGWLSVSTLIGVVLGSWVGWWWADPVASLVIVVFAIREGREEWECEED
jgi:divalent metal cation (Fe/Co/Zn/Cd) transporter